MCQKHFGEVWKVGCGGTGECKCNAGSGFGILWEEFGVWVVGEVGMRAWWLVCRSGPGGLMRLLGVVCAAAVPCGPCGAKREISARGVTAGDYSVCGSFGETEAINRLLRPSRLGDNLAQRVRARSAGPYRHDSSEGGE